MKKKKREVKVFEKKKDYLNNNQIGMNKKDQIKDVKKPFEIKINIKEIKQTEAKILKRINSCRNHKIAFENNINNASYLYNQNLKDKFNTIFKDKPHLLTKIEEMEQENKNKFSKTDVFNKVKGRSCSFHGKKVKIYYFN